MSQPVSDAERFPLLNEAGRRMLRRLKEHPHAPRYNYQVGERLTARGLENVRAYARRQQGERAGWGPGRLPGWLPDFVAYCRREVPFHRHRPDWSDDFLSLPPVGREALRQEPWAFVPDDADVSELIVYATTGTTGSRLHLPAHPEAPNRYLPLLETALAARGVRLEGGERVSIVHVCAQTRTYTLASVISYLDFAGFAKVNLSPAEWRDPDDRARFLDDCAPEVYTGDPFAFSELARLPLRSRPKALISSATALPAGLQRRLEGHFGCPALDVYSLTEAGPVAHRVGDGHEVLPWNLLVEVLDPAGRPCPPGVRGEIVVTGGANPYLPLLRYRTGDFAALGFDHPIPRLVGFEGRPPVVYRTADGRLVPSIEVTLALEGLPLPFFSLHQRADGALRFSTRCEGALLPRIEQGLRDLLGAGLPLEVEQVAEDAAWGGKMLRYTSELELS